MAPWTRSAGLACGWLPEIDVNDDGAQIMQRRDQIRGEKCGLAHPPLSGKKESGAQGSVQKCRPQQLPGHFLGEGGTTEGHGLQSFWLFRKLWRLHNFK